MAGRKVLITSRIFAPEPSAASFRLRALAKGLFRAGHDVQVLTVKDGGGRAEEHFDFPVRRWPVKRDSSGYVRGYVSYMSFDIPLFFRVLLARKPAVVITEPPPTTGAVIRLVCWIRRIPYLYYAADVWADAAAQTGASPMVLRVLRALEVWAWSGAAGILSVSPGVTVRLKELGVTRPVHTVGNGIDAALLNVGLGQPAPLGEPYFVYAGTASEVHGAGIFLDAFRRQREFLRPCRLVFIGGGVDRLKLEEEAEAAGLSGQVIFLPTVRPEELAPWLAHSVASLASVRPGLGYDFAFPTKLYSSAACGAPMIHSGAGPAQEFLATTVDGRPLGRSVVFDVEAVGTAMTEAFSTYSGETVADRTAHRTAVRDWAVNHVSLEAVTDRIEAVVRAV
ncbi:glycosyltransferase [Arthrobacter sp. RAF14]|uniref:glycosyltransferase n=1 Tax=Arthrobacter sp. RAF14 TaxID=3233051 RepID=UPI003F937450